MDDAAPRAARPPAASRARRWLAWVLLAGSPCLVAGAFLQPFIKYDDHKIVLENPLSREGFASPAALEQTFRPPVGGFKGFYSQYTPLTYVSLAAQYRLHGPQAWAFRLGNLLFHLGSAWLLFHVLLALLPRDAAPPRERTDHGAAVAAALGAAFFFFHPTTVETVAWAAERNNAQALFFCLLAWWLQVGGVRGELPWPRLTSPTPARYAGVWLAYAAALLSKPLAVGFAPVLILTELLLMAGPWRFLRAAGLMLPAFVAAWWAGSAAGRNILPPVGGGYATWALTSLSLLGRYVTHVFVPWPLSFFYGVAPVRDGSDPEFWRAVGLLGGLGLWLAARRVEWRRGVVLGLGSLLALAPSLSPYTISYLFQDRYLYFALPVAVALLTVAAGTWTGTPRAKRVRAGAVAALCAVFAALSLARSFDFRSAEVLFHDAAEKEPQSYFAHYFVAQDLYLRALDEQPARARQLLEEAALQIRQSHQAVDRERDAWATKSLLLEGSILAKLESPAAPPVLRKVIEDAGPRDSEVQIQAMEVLVELARRGYARTKDREQLEEAVLWLLAILEVRPAHAEARIRLAEAYESLGEKDAARAEYQRLRDDPRLGARARTALERLAR